MSPTGQHPPCSNCQERGLKCVDEFAEVKAVKMLRRGRRLQQVEAVYGKTSPDESSLHSVVTPPSVTPRIRPEFFESSFFRRFHIQRPILEPVEFRERFTDSLSNPNALSIPGQLICLVLVIWAASFGVDEYGREDMLEGVADSQPRPELVRDMLQELLYLIDIHGVLRKPSWDGVRLLFLLLPLTQELQSPAERLVMHETALIHAQTLCSPSSSLPVRSTMGDYIDAVIKARVFWHGYMLDGVTSGLRGGRLMMNHDDLIEFEATLPPRPDGSSGSAVYALAHTYAAVPIRISGVCRQVHASLTGPKARRALLVDEESLNYTWKMLDRCWKELDELRQYGTGDLVDVEDIERFINAWQIKIFECHNLIREALKQRLGPSDSYVSSSGPETSRVRNDIIRLHDNARSRCHSVVRNVVTIIQRNLGTSFFQFDAALVRDGCFFAGFLLAGESGSKAEVDICLQALREIRWIFSKSEERMQTVRMVWESRIAQLRGQERSNPSSPSGDSFEQLLGADYSFSRRNPPRSASNPPLALLSMSSLPTPSSAPNTAYTDDGGWPTTTPGSSRAGSHGSIPSHHGSPSVAVVSMVAPSQDLSGMAKSLSMTTSEMLVGPAQPPVPFARAGDVADAYYYPSYDYPAYGESSGAQSTDLGLETQAVSSSSVSYHPSQFLAESMTFTGVVTQEPANDFHAHSADNGHGSQYVPDFYP